MFKKWMVFTLCFAINGPIRAQQIETLTPAQQSAAIKRAEKFLASVAALSPLPAGADPDLAQRNPRTLKFNDNIDGNLEPRSRVYQPKVTFDTDRDPSFPETMHRVEVYKSELEVAINPKSGAVTSFQDNILARRLVMGPEPDKGKLLTKEQALSRAVKYFEATGLPAANLMLDRIQFLNNPPLHRWYVRWVRVEQGVQYEGQWAHIFLDAENGRLLAYHSRLGAPAPHNVLPKVSLEEAIMRVGQRLQELGNKVVGIRSAAIRIAQVTDYWIAPRKYFQPASPGYEGYATYPKSRICWFLSADLDQPGGYKICNAYVDIETGTLINGEMTGTRTGISRLSTPIPAPNAMALLAQPKSVEVTPSSGSPIPVDLASKQGKKSYYAALGTLSGVIQNDYSDRFEESHKLTITAKDGRVTEIACDSKQRLLKDKEGRQTRFGVLFERLIVPGKKAKR